LQEIAFRYAVDRVNMDRVLLPKTTLVPVIEHVPTFDSFKTAERGSFFIIELCTNECADMLFAPVALYTQPEYIVFLTKISLIGLK